MPLTREIEVDRNYDFFQRNLGVFLSSHRGEYALLKDRQLVDFFSGPGEAYRAGLARFPDEIFSIQEVSEDPVQLGHMSIAVD